MVAGGEEFRVVDRATGEDITSLILAQVFLEGVKHRTAQIPRGVLERLIRWGGRPGAKTFPDPQEVAAKARDEVQRIVADLVGRGRLTFEEALELRQKVSDSVQRIVGEAQRGVEGVLGRVLKGRDPALRLLKERLMVSAPSTKRSRGKRRKKEL